MDRQPGIKSYVSTLVNSFRNPTPLPGAFIVDVSGYTGEIDHTQLTPYVEGRLLPKIHGAIVRVVDGAAFDVWGLANYRGFKALGLPVGVYAAHYPRAEAAANRRQAQKLLAFLALVSDDPPDLGAWADYEKNPDKLGFGPIREAIWKYIYTYEGGALDELGIYTNSWWDTNVANERNGRTDIPFGNWKPAFRPRGRRAWFASWYTPNCYTPYDWRYRYGTGIHVFHQYDNRFQFPGVPGSVDASTFNGTLLDFYAYFNLGITPPPPAEIEMKYLVKSNLKVRSEPVYKADDSNVVGLRLAGDVVIPRSTVGDETRTNSYWVQDERGWSAAQWNGAVLMEPFV